MSRAGRYFLGDAYYVEGKARKQRGLQIHSIIYTYMAVQSSSSISLKVNIERGTKMWPDFEGQQVAFFRAHTTFFSEIDEGTEGAENDGIKIIPLYIIWSVVGSSSKR